MIPGPTELPYSVIQALNQPPTIQYDRRFDEGVLEPTTLALRDVFQTRHEVILLPGSGRTALEAGAASVIEPGDPCLSWWPGSSACSCARSCPGSAPP
jgi:aspartate aminotransferase-like enzyme